jgi:Golgi apparatus protein 1
MRTLLLRLAPFALLAAVLPAAPAQAGASCVDDAARLCPGIPANDGRLWACLLRNQMQLSSDCLRNLQEVQRRVSEFGADCAGDVQRFCPWTQPGQWRILDCLSVHVGRRELSTNCEDAVVTALENVQEFADACTDDSARLCAGVQPGGGRLFLCLRSQSDRLSSRCRRAVNP